MIKHQSSKWRSPNHFFEFLRFRLSSVAESLESCVSYCVDADRQKIPHISGCPTLSPFWCCHCDSGHVHLSFRDCRLRENYDIVNPGDVVIRAMQNVFLCFDRWGEVFAFHHVCHCALTLVKLAQSQRTKNRVFQLPIMSLRPISRALSALTVQTDGKVPISLRRIHETQNLQKFLPVLKLSKNQEFCDKWTLLCLDLSKHLALYILHDWQI